jgi:hypothetical protein
MSAKTRTHKVKRSRRHVRRPRSKRSNIQTWLLLIGGGLLITAGLSILLNQVPFLQQDWQGAITDARSLAADNLLPLTEPVEPIEGWHDMAHLPDPNQPGRTVPPDQPQPDADVPVTEYDFGTIPPGPGNVSQVYYIQNTGTEPLEISNVTTSCGCTRALLSSRVIPPGTRADLTAIFDPDYHDTAGPVKRVIWLETNDPDQPVVAVSFTANVRKG